MSLSILTWSNAVHEQVEDKYWGFPYALNLEEMGSW